MDGIAAAALPADDSMHGTITPNNRVLNDVIGATTVSLYAWFDYRWVLRVGRVGHEQWLVCMCAANGR